MDIISQLTVYVYFVLMLPIKYTLPTGSLNVVHSCPVWKNDWSWPEWKTKQHDFFFLIISLLRCLTLSQGDTSALIKTTRQFSNIKRKKQPNNVYVQKQDVRASCSFSDNQSLESRQTQQTHTYTQQMLTACILLYMTWNRYWEEECFPSKKTCYLAWEAKTENSVHFQTMRRRRCCKTRLSSEEDEGGLGLKGRKQTKKDTARWEDQTSAHT